MTLVKYPTGKAIVSVYEIPASLSDINDNQYSVNTIASSAFDGIYADIIMLPKSIKKIEERAFKNIFISVREIRINMTKEEWEQWKSA